MKVTFKGEGSLCAWVLRMCIGPAMVTDGIIHTLTLGCVSAGLSLTVTRELAKERFWLQSSNNS